VQEARAGSAVCATSAQVRDDETSANKKKRVFFYKRSIHVLNKERRQEVGAHLLQKAGTLQQKPALLCVFHLENIEVLELE
jgi:hypothetical protein